jgi:murein L,D-transpeptidase YcbB/YkuD
MTNCVLTRARSPTSTGRSGRTVCDVEQALDLPIRDCIYGQEVTAAVKKFQQEHALTVTGQLDRTTLKALGIRN